MFYNYAILILATIGAFLGLAGYYLNIVCEANYERWLWVGMTILLVSSGVVMGRLIRRLTLSSHTDFLTNLWNRRYLYLRLAEEEARATRKKTFLCMAMIDIDDFKHINDTYGHAIGDALLTDLAAILKKNTRLTDVVARWGGDEFAIVFSDTSLQEAMESMERIRLKVETRFATSYGLTISAGVISLEPDQDIRDLLIRADQALYNAKTRKNAVVAVSK